MFTSCSANRRRIRTAIELPDSSQGLRFQHSKFPAVCGKAALYSPQSGEGWVVRTSGGRGVKQFSDAAPLAVRGARDLAEMDGAETRTNGGKALSNTEPAHSNKKTA